MDASQAIEVSLRSSGFNGCILGCDEVGRGPLAGPATVACVAFPPQLDEHYPLFSQLDDSKKLSAKKRSALVDQISNAAAAFAIIDISPQEIDAVNILQACLEGMRRASQDVLEKLGHPQNIKILIDGNRTIKNFPYPQSAYVKGDARSWSIAAASILAKVHRDALMLQYDKIYPGYGFAKNVGYPTKAHQIALKTLGMTPIHRRSFHLKSHPLLPL